ncbi:MAG: hypothetical protein AAF682_11805 [Planctomycetota bacterium]
MPFSHTATLLALAAAGTPSVQDGPARSGFDALATDPYAAGVFQELDVASGPPVRVLAQTVRGNTDGAPFVNVLRWADARALRGKLIALRVPVQLHAPSLDTSARLWVRVLRADGTIAFEDDGLDSASSASEWTTLSSVGAIAEDATDLCFGLVVEGSMQARMRAFQLELRGDVAPLDPRHAIPERWARDPDVRSSHAADPGRGLDLRVTSFLPPGHTAGDLPHLWLLLEEHDLRETYRMGRALLHSMRLAQDPPAIVSLVQPGRGRLPEPLTSGDGAESTLSLLHQLVPERAAGASQLVATSEDAPRLAASVGELAAGTVAEKLGGDDYLCSERVLLRWLCAQQDSGGDQQLAELLFEASLETLTPWAAALTVQQASHSLEGHECEHDHDHSGHDHSGHDHSGHDHSGHDQSGHDLKHL